MKSPKIQIFILLLLVAFGAASTGAQTVLRELPSINPPVEFHSQLDTTYTRFMKQHTAKVPPVSIYSLPYSFTGTRKTEDWHRMWINTAVLAGAYVSTLFVLECLPEDATSWNRAELQQDSPATRWFNDVFKRGPEWDHDNPVFNYILHPYAGAVYFMSARSCGFNFYRSLLYCSIISTVGWEFGIEACMERPSIQDIFITPLVGSVIGECFYKIKRHIVSNGYTLAGSRFLGGFVAFLVDPVNEVIDLFRGSRTRHLFPSHRNTVSSSLMPMVGNGTFSIAFSCTF